MTDNHLAAGTYSLGDRAVNRMGYGAMQLAGPGVFGPPKDRNTAVAVLREAIASGGRPHRHERFLRSARHQSDHLRGAASLSEGDLVIVTKVGAVRGNDASWIPARTPADLTRARCMTICRNLRVDVLDVVNLRVGGIHGPSEDPIEEQFATLANLQRQGVIRHLGLSNVTSGQLKQARSIANVVCIQNNYNLAHRDDDFFIDELAQSGIAYVPFFPLGGFVPLQSSILSDVARELGTTPLQVALAWLLHRSGNILLIPGTSSVNHLRENLAAANLSLSDNVLARLEAIHDVG